MSYRIPITPAEIAIAAAQGHTVCRDDSGQYWAEVLGIAGWYLPEAVESTHLAPLTVVCVPWPDRIYDFAWTLEEYRYVHGREPFPGYLGKPKPSLEQRFCPNILRQVRAELAYE